MSWAMGFDPIHMYPFPSMQLVVIGIAQLCRRGNKTFNKKNSRPGTSGTRHDGGIWWYRSFSCVSFSSRPIVHAWVNAEFDFCLPFLCSNTECEVGTISSVFMPADEARHFGTKGDMCKKLRLFFPTATYVFSVANSKEKTKCSQDVCSLLWIVYYELWVVNCGCLADFSGCLLSFSTFFSWLLLTWPQSVLIVISGLNRTALT